MLLQCRKLNVMLLCGVTLKYRSKRNMIGSLLGEEKRCSMNLHWFKECKQVHVIRCQTRILVSGVVHLKIEFDTVIYSGKAEIFKK